MLLLSSLNLRLVTSGVLCSGAGLAGMDFLLANVLSTCPFSPCSVTPSLTKKAHSLPILFTSASICILKGVFKPVCCGGS